MLQTIVTGSEEQGEQGIESPLSSELVLEELRRILNSRHFRKSNRSKQFLQYVVNQQLGGNADALKERLIGAEIFGREPDYATGEDPVVRVQASEVRRRLELYRAENQMPGHVMIDLPSGSYVPVFRICQPGVEHDSAGEPDNPAPVAGGPSQDSDPAANIGDNASSEAVRSLDLEMADILHPPLNGRTATRRITFGVAASLILVCVLAAIAYQHYSHMNGASRADGSLEQFWNPALKSSKPVLLALPNPILYRPSPALFKRYQRSHPEEFRNQIERYNRVLPLPPQSVVRWKDLEPTLDSGPAIGGVLAVVNVARMLAQQGRSFNVLFGDNASFSEMRNSPTVIIGGLNSEWAKDITSKVPFVFLEVDGQLTIHEDGGAKRNWKMAFGPKGELVRDYGLITRQVVSETGQFLVQVAGINDQGTEAASEVVSDPAELHAALAIMPKNWYRKNLQIVICTDVVDGRAGATHVVASSVW